MRKRRNWLKTTIAMLTLIATVLETGFSTVSTLAAEITTEDGIVVNTDAVDETDLEAGQDEDLQINVSSDDDYVGEADEDSYVGSGEDAYAEESYEDTEDPQEGTLDITGSGIRGSGYDEVSVYVDTENLRYRDSFRIEFEGPDSASYNPVVNNEDLYKTNDGRYDFDNLGGGAFTVRAYSSDDVILSYKYNEDGYPTIVVESEPVEKVLDTKIMSIEDGTRVDAISGEGFDKVTVKFDTDDLSDKASFTLFVESDADATVGGKDATRGIKGITNETESVVIEDLEEQSFIAYVVKDADYEYELEAVADIAEVEDGIVEFDINDVATKRVYDYEDSKVFVRATLEKADAIPDDAYFCVTPLSEEEAKRYLDYLNANKEEDAEEFTADNTLLYDIAFYTDESKSEEIEPEEGSVSISVQFKKNQLEEDLGVEAKEEIEVIHITEEGSKLEAETLEVEQNGELNSVDVVTDSFSIFVITARSGSQNINVKNPGEESTKGLLGDAWTYGITANTWEFDGEAETNFAVKYFTGKNGAALGGEGFHTGVSDKAGEAEYQYVMIGKVNGTATIKERDCDLYIPDSEKDKINGTGGCNVNKIITAKEKIDGDIDAMFTYVNGVSSRLAAADSVESYDNLPGEAYGDKGMTIDISQAPDGTYYINVDKYPDLFNAFTEQTKVKIVKKSGQKIVFNYPETKKVVIKDFTVEQNGQSYQAQSMASIATSGMNPIVEDIIFNLPSATMVDLYTTCGIFLATKATVNWHSATGGWLVCNKAVSDGEWHFLNGKLKKPNPPVPGKVKVQIPVNKKFIGGQGNWQNGFTFTLERITDSDWEAHNDSQTPQTITFKSGDSDTATGYFNLEFDDTIANNVHWDTNYDRQSFDNYEWVHTEWYRISELHDRPDVQYDLLNLLGYTYSNGKYYDNDWNEIDPTYWYVHLFIYKDDQQGYFSGWGKNAEYKVVLRTARVNPKTFPWGYKALPCEEERPIWFKNKYVSPPKVVLEGEKKLNNSTDGVPSGKFKFTLQPYNKDSHTWDPVTDKFTVTNNGSAFAFPEIELDLTKAASVNNNVYTFYYKIDETNDCAPYGPDDAEFIAVVTATKNGDSYSVDKKYYRFDDPSKLSKKSLDKATVTSLYFNNTYDATGETVVYGFKSFEGRDLDDDDVFTFVLSSSDDKQKNANQSKTFRVGDVKAADRDGNGFNFEFDKLTYGLKDDGKTYHYTVKEAVGNGNNIIYDSNEYPVNITLTDDGNNNIDVDQSDGKKTSPITFINKYSAAGEVPFGAHKIYEENTKLSSKKEFSFTLEGGKIDTTGNVIAAEKISKTASRTGAGPVSFGSVQFKKDKDNNDVGTYKYTIREVIPQDASDYPGDSTKKIKDGIIYDARIYNVTVVVTDNKSGELQIAKTGAYDSDQQIDINSIDPGFVNDYKVDEVKAPINGRKAFPNGKLERGMFTFNLEAYDDTTKDAIKAGTVVMPASTSAKNGVPDTLDVDAFKFDDITFKSAGTYKFIVNEDPDKFVGNDTIKKENVIFTTDNFVVTIVIEDNGAGKLKVSDNNGLTASKVGTDGIVDIVFVNTPYNPGEVPVIAYKDLTGRKIAKDQFEFTLRDAKGDVIDSAKNDENGIATFKNLSYEYKDLENGAETIFTYTIKEEIPNGAKDNKDGTWSKDGYTYDGHTETVHVTVTPGTDSNGEGTLTVTSDNGNDVQKAIFRNKYNAEGSTKFDGIKYILGRAFEKEDENKWYAVLLDADNNDKEIQKVPITKKGLIGSVGEFKFAEIKYTEEGEYHYKVKEAGPDTETEHLDKSIYDVTVTVVDEEGKGVLTATPSFSKNGAAVSMIEFDNPVDYKNKVVFTAHKEVKGTVLEDKQFEFTLKDASGKVIDTAKNNAGGLVEFKGIEYFQNKDRQDADNSPFVYTISEVIKNMDGWTLSTAEYRAKAFVTLEGDELKVDKKYYVVNADGSETEVDEAKVIFENVYEANGKVQVYAKKKLNGKDMPAGTFTFQLYDEKDPNKNVYKATTATDVASGKEAIATFPEIEYTEETLKQGNIYKIGEKKYVEYFKMKEEHPDDAVEQTDGSWVKDGYTYDGTIYNVVVVLEDVGKGKIDTDWYAYKSGETPVQATFIDWIVSFLGGTDKTKDGLFVNDYEAEGHLDLSAKKILEGKTLTDDDDFVFILKQGDKELETKSTKKDGVVGSDGTVTVNFTTIDYSIYDQGKNNYKDPVNYNYTIVEQYKGQTINGIKYSDEEYSIAVTVQDEKTGKLKVDASINGAPAVTSVDLTADGKVNTCQPDAVEFTNTYEPKDVSIVLGGFKAFSGRDLKEGDEFSFTMKKADQSAKEFKPVTVTKTAGTTWDSGKFAFPAITYTPADMAETVDQSGKILTYARYKTFKYEIYEEIPNETKGITYDTKHYYVTVVVENNNGVLSASAYEGENVTVELVNNHIEVTGGVLWGTNNDALIDRASFNNTYAAEGAIIFSAKKTVTGRKTDDEFKFNLTDESGKVLNSITVKGDGVPVYFLDPASTPNDQYTFKYSIGDKDKTFVYYIEEEIPDPKKPFYRYSETKYKIEVTPKDLGDGSLVATAKKTVVKADNLPNFKDNDEYTDSVFEFINEYDAVGTFDITGKKILNVVEDGKEVDIKKIDPNFELPTFTFQLIEKDVSGNFFDAEGKPLRVIAQTDSDKNGDFAFKLADDFYKLADAGHEFDYKVVEVTPDGYDPLEENRIGFTYDMTEYDVHVTVSDKDDKNKDGKLIVEKVVTGSESEAAKANNAVRKTVLDYIKGLFNTTDGPDCVYVNLYDSVGIIDPPIVTKKIMGREIMPGEFKFEVTGVYGADEASIISMVMSGKHFDVEQDRRKDEFKIVQTVENGYIPGTKDTSFEYTNPLTKEKKTIVLDPGELYVGNVEIRYSDLKKTDADGYKYDDFIFQARELDSKDTNVTDSDAVLFLFVHAVDQKNGKILTTGHGAGGKLIWEKVNKETGALEEVKEEDIAFENKWHAKGSLDIRGFKAMIGRDLAPEDENKYSFSIVDLSDSANKYTTTNKMNGKTGIPSVVEFAHYDEKQNPDGVKFLNYRFDYGEKSADPDDDVDDTGIHRYKIYEEKPENGQDYDKRYYIVTVDVVMPVDESTGYYKKNADLDVTIKDVKRYLESGIEDPDWEFARTRTDEQFIFENPFDAVGDFQLSGTKKVVDETGKAVSNVDAYKRQFKFELWEYPDASRKSGVVVASGQTDENGNYSIKPFKSNKKHYFDQDDLYVGGKFVESRDFYYTLKESLPSNGFWNEEGLWESEGVIYDNTEYLIKVTIKRGNPGELDVSVTGIAKQNGNSAVDIDHTKMPVDKLDYTYRYKGFDFTNTLKEFVEVAGTKYWIDKGDPTDHPAITIDLFSSAVGDGKTVIAKYTIEPGETTYFFDADSAGKRLPKYDAKGKPIHYDVEEEGVYGYLSEKNGYDFYNSKGDILIRKVNADTGAPLAGATLAILDGSKEIERWVTGPSAHVVEKDLTAGKTYTLHEISAPEGFEVAADQTFTVPAKGETITVTMSDKPIIGSVKLTKRDATTREALAGAQFALYTESGARIYASGSAGSYRATTSSSNYTLETDSTGSLTVADLPYGTYYFEETKAPDGYTLSTERLGFTILKSGELVEVTYLNTKAVGSVRLRKVGSTGTGRLAGALFELYAATPTSVGQAAASTIFGDAYYRVGQFRTNSAGEIYVGDLPWDKYYFVEVEAPEGYEIARDVNGDDLVYTFTISASTTSATIDLGGIVNTPVIEEEPPQVLGERIKRGGVVNGVLGVRAKPNSGVLGERIGPVTGDASNIVLWLLLLCACVATIVATVVTGKKKKAAK